VALPNVPALFAFDLALLVGITKAEDLSRVQTRAV
jgi:hypothetical protein